MITVNFPWARENQQTKELDSTTLYDIWEPFFLACKNTAVISHRRTWDMRGHKSFFTHNGNQMDATYTYDSKTTTLAKDNWYE